MRKINLTNDEQKLLKSVIPKRIKMLESWSTPEQYRRAMWPVQVTTEEMHKYNERYAMRIKNIELYKKILAKLEK
tara:strand:+ start:461 stop:685 length:225 start_codon:yes stop_codon:yes gene_type:complete